MTLPPIDAHIQARLKATLYEQPLQSILLTKRRKELLHLNPDGEVVKEMGLVYRLHCDRLWHTRRGTHPGKMLALLHTKGIFLSFDGCDDCL